MAAGDRRALLSCCMVFAIALVSANTADFWESDVLVASGAPARQPSRPQAVQPAGKGPTGQTSAVDTRNTPKESRNVVASSSRQQAHPTEQPAAAQKQPQQQQKQQQQQQQHQQQQQPIKAASDYKDSDGADIPGLPLAFYGDTMGRLTKDIRGVYLSLEPQRLLVTMRENGDPTQPPSAFTYSSRLFCAWSGMSDNVGRCDVSASLLPADPSNRFNRQALTIARCELTAAARACDPQFANGQIILGTGQVAVVLAQDPGSTTTNIRSFSGDVLVDNIYPTGRPDTVLAGLIGFRRGSMRFDVKTGASPITQNSKYDGRVTFYLYKGPF